MILPRQTTIPIAGMVLLLLALLLGLNLPDLDHQVSFLRHRSILTHGFLVPLAVFLAVYKEKATTPRFLSMGFSLAAVIHLCFDLFPRAWTGFALITIPLWGRSSALFSWLWISVSIIVCLYLTFILIRTLVDVLVAFGSLALAFAFYASTEAVFWPALVTLVVAVGITLALPANSRAILRSLVLNKRRP
jgi:hypothetical protein